MEELEDLGFMLIAVTPLTRTAKSTEQIRKVPTNTFLL